MRNKYIFFLFLSLGLFFLFKFYLEKDSPTINVQGRAESISANIQKGDLNSFSSKPIDKSKIIAVIGRVKSKRSDVLIPIKRLGSKKLITYTNSDGIFNFNLKPGIYTFFIINENYAYLNSFDGKGYFKSYKIFSEIDDIVIKVTSRSYF